MYRRTFPPLDYKSRGAPTARMPKFTTYGYLIENVPLGGGRSVCLTSGESGRARRTLTPNASPPRRLAQRAMPLEKSATRTRKSACVIRPERGLSVRQIMDGEYFCRPDTKKYLELVADVRRAASDLEPPRQPGGGKRAMTPSQSEPMMMPGLRADSSAVGGTISDAARSAAMRPISATLRG